MQPGEVGRSMAQLLEVGYPIACAGMTGYLHAQPSLCYSCDDGLFLFIHRRCRSTLCMNMIVLLYIVINKCAKLCIQNTLPRRRLQICHSRSPMNLHDRTIEWFGGHLSSLYCVSIIISQVVQIQQHSH